VQCSSFRVAFFGSGHDDRLLLVNLGVDLHLNPAPEPFLRPEEIWTLLWSSEDFPTAAGSKVTEDRRMAHSVGGFALKPKKT
jgi:hypothetical protein